MEDTELVPKTSTSSRFISWVRNLDKKTIGAVVAATANIVVIALIAFAVTPLKMEVAIQKTSVDLTNAQLNSVQMQMNLSAVIGMAARLDDIQSRFDDANAEAILLNHTVSSVTNAVSSINSAVAVLEQKLNVTINSGRNGTCVGDVFNCDDSLPPTGNCISAVSLFNSTVIARNPQVSVSFSCAIAPNSDKVPLSMEYAILSPSQGTTFISDIVPSTVGLAVTTYNITRLLPGTYSLNDIQVRAFFFNYFRCVYFCVTFQF